MANKKKQRTSKKLATHNKTESQNKSKPLNKKNKKPWFKKKPRAKHRTSMDIFDELKPIVKLGFMIGALVVALIVIAIRFQA